MSFCAVDFGTSNSALAVPAGVSVRAAENSPGALPGGFRLAELEPGQHTMPTAVFYATDDGTRKFGREAVAAYVDGLEGRLMRSIKSILGSDLMERTTELGDGHSVRYRDVVVGYLRHLRVTAEGQFGRPLRKVVLGRPVFFVDGDPLRDAQAQSVLAEAAQAAGFEDVEFAYEPIAAALDYESRIDRETLVLVADIGGGTSDFSLVKASPQRHHQTDRRSDILGNHGVHIAGTDFDREINLAVIQPTLGLGSAAPDGRPVPSSIYHELSTWHLINTTATPSKLAQLRQMRSMYANDVLHTRLLDVLQRRLGHALAARAEQAKIDVAMHGLASVDLSIITEGLFARHDTQRQAQALDGEVQRIVAAARETVRLAGVSAGAVEALYFTGGSTGFERLVEAIAAAFPTASRARGDRFTAVVGGLAIAAHQRYAS